jgi:L-alanine-DL-glutamate epimerase-like enolase superfamily enzyme
MSSTFAKLADLPLQIESCDLQGLSRDISMGFERLTTVVSLQGGGEEGVGEDVVSYPADQVAFQQAGAPDLTGSWTLAELGAHVDGLDLFTTGPLFGAYRVWRRWAFHSAALDLALRQAGRALHEVLGVEPRPMTFVLSTGLGEPASTDGLRELLGRYPDLRLKLDASASWDDRLLGELAELDAVDTVDFKSFTPDLGDANPADPALYRRVAEALPHAWLEDPNLASPEADAALAPYRDRITWDTPMRSMADIQALAFTPRMINIKPSRFGSLQALCAGYDFCAEQGIGVYAGGMFELGPGRGQAQYLASLFHPEAPNDIAPAGYNDSVPADGLPASPLPPVPALTGFGWESSEEAA